MGPVVAPGAILDQLGPVWERAKRPIIALLVVLLAIIALLAWIDLM